MKLSMKTGLMAAATLLALTLAVTPRVHAEGPAISGFIDTTYNYNFNKPYNGTNYLRSFDTKANSFLMNAAQLQLTGTLGDAGYVVKFLAGTDASVITSAGAGAADDFDLEEAYLTYKCPLTGITLKGGKFATPMGIEVIESKDDPTISRGYLFGLAEAYTHTGVIVGHALGSKADIGLGVVNGWDNTVDNNTGKTLLGKLGLNLGDPLSVTVSALYGPEQTEDTSTTSATVINGVPTSVNGNTRSSVDVVLVSKIIPKVTLNVQGNMGSEKGPVVLSHGFGTRPGGDTWGGAGLQPVVSITDKFSIGSRLEYFYDKWGSRIPAGSAVAAVDHLALTNFSIAPAYKITDNFTTRLEYRYDTANKKVFVNDSGTPKDSSSTVSVEWILTF